MQLDVRTGTALWVRLASAPERFDRPRRTIEKWITDKQVRTMRPLQEVWLYLPDLERMDAQTQRRKRRTT